MIRAKKANNMDVKRFNKASILRVIAEHDKVSQQDISLHLNISVPTVLQNVRELVEDGLVHEVGEFESTGGRKAKAFALARDSRLAVGLDFTEECQGMVAVNLAGETVAMRRLLVPYKNCAEYYRRVGRELADFIRENGLDADRIVGAGLSIPGIINREETNIDFSHILNIRNVPTENFSRHIPHDCLFINDANAAGYAEFYQRESTGNAIYLSLSSCVGGAIFMGNELYFGDSRRAGEFGHNTVVPGGRTCYCGKKGCFDAYCCTKVLVKSGVDDLTPFFERLEKKDAAAVRIWDEYCHYLCVAVNNLNTTFDCDVIIGGYVGAYLDSYSPALRRRLSKLNTFNADGAYLKICNCKHEASATGAALRHIVRFIDDIV